MTLIKPPWLKIRPPSTEKYEWVKSILHERGMHTVCRESRCPNISECWSEGIATFIVMGEICTRACKFCNVKTGFPAAPLDSKEPENLAKTVKKMGLNYVVITSVDRDDLKDQGASHFAACIKELKKQIPAIIVEVLIPDFSGSVKCLETVVKARPDVMAHNIETVKRLQGAVRDPRAGYEQSLSVLENVKEINPDIYTKSSIMVGLGEEVKEVIEAMHDLRNSGVQILTLGQYLRPSGKHIPVIEYVNPNVFEHYKAEGEKMGFLYMLSGPFVRSSYKARKLFPRKCD